MKHNLNATIFLLSFFLITQILGLFLIGLKAEVHQITDDKGDLVNVVIQNDGIERPEFSTDYGSFIWLTTGIFLGTLLLLLLRKFKKPKIWKYWFLLAVITTITITLSVILPYIIALIIAIILALLKVFNKNIIIHNLTEILMYTGLGVLIVPLFTLFWASMLLILISFYDMFAVWKSKHMIKMAEFMTQSTFAGLMFPYNKNHNKIKGKIKITNLKNNKNSDEKVAILGGGDVAFPLIFSGVILRWLLSNNFSLIKSFSMALIVSIIAGIALTLLFVLGKKDRFYPAMPYISSGSFLGLLLIYLLNWIF